MPSEYVVNWTGGRIGLGASVFHFAGTNSPTVAQGCANAIREFFQAIRTNLPTPVTIIPTNEVRVMNEAGVLTAVLPVAKPANVIGTGGLGFTNGAGGMIRWNTPSIVAGRRLLGRTYLVPLADNAFTNGNLTGAATAGISVAGDALIAAMASASGPLQVWSRVNGVVAEVLNCTVPDRPSMLTTRNDRA